MNPHRPTGPSLSLKTCAICGGVSARHAEHVCLRMVDPEAAEVAKKPPPKSRILCAMGHPHRSKGEATACEPVYRAAAMAGLVVFRPGEPGIPCFRLPGDENGRPAYASVDWVLCDAAGTPVLGMDYKGTTPKSLRYDRKSWPRTKRIFEAATGAKCVELKELSDIGAAVRALDTHAAGAAGRQE